MTKRQNYRYTECGLDNVVIEGLEMEIDDAGETVYCIPNVVSLHRVIAHGIIAQKTGLSGREFRYLRTEMGLTQSELAEKLKVSRLTINRWEQAKTEIDANAQVVIRMLAAERLKIDPELSVEEMANRSIWSAEREPIRIDGTNPSAYQLIAA